MGAGRTGQCLHLPLSLHTMSTRLSVYRQGEKVSVNGQISGCDGEGD